MDARKPRPCWSRHMLVCVQGARAVRKRIVTARRGLAGHPGQLEFGPGDRVIGVPGDSRTSRTRSTRTASAGSAGRCSTPGARTASRPCRPARPSARAAPAPTASSPTSPPGTSNASPRTSRTPRSWSAPRPCTAVPAARTGRTGTPPPAPVGPHGARLLLLPHRQRRLPHLHLRCPTGPSANGHRTDPPSPDHSPPPTTPVSNDAIDSAAPPGQERHLDFRQHAGTNAPAFRKALRNVYADAFSLVKLCDSPGRSKETCMAERNRA